MSLQGYSGSPRSCLGDRSARSELITQLKARMDKTVNLQGYSGLPRSCLGNRSARSELITQNASYQISNSRISWIRLDRKHYVLEPRFGADPGQRNREILKWRDPLGVRPCLYFGLTAVAKILPLFIFEVNPGRRDPAAFKFWVCASRTNPAAFKFYVCPSRTNPAGFKPIGKTIHFGIQIWGRPLSKKS